MKFSINRTDLNKAIKAVYPAIKSSIIIPICETIKFDLSEDKLILTATNMQVEITATIVGKFDQIGSFCLSAQKLKNLVENLADQPLSFEQKQTICIIASSSGRYELPVSDSVDFPVFKLDTEKAISVKSDLFVNAIKKTVFACSDNFEDKPQQTGVFIEILDSKLLFTSTDSHRVNHAEFPISSEIKSSLIIPGSSLLLLPEFGSDLEISFSSNSLCIISDSISFKSTLIDAEFPAYRGVIPVNDKVLTIDRLAFLSAIKRVTGFSSTKTNLLKLQTGEKIVISGQNVEYSEYGEEELKADYPHEEIKMGLSCEYLAESIAAFECKDIYLLLSAPNKGVLIKENIEDSTYIMVMPMQLI